MASFSFCDFADDYFGHKASAVEATALLLALHSAPVRFHRKGKGRYRKAPADILAAALAGFEKKRQQALCIERMVGELKAFALPPEFGPMLNQLLYKPDRNRPEPRRLKRLVPKPGCPPRICWKNAAAFTFGARFSLSALLVRIFSARYRFPCGRIAAHSDGFAACQCAGLFD